MEKIVYYEDELNDEFSGDDITPRVIDENYKYITNNFFKKVTHIFWYRIIANPIAHIYLHFKFRHKIINKKVIKKNNQAYFLIGNHTQALADAVIPTMITGWRDCYIVTNSNNVSVKGIGNVAHSLGALPLPDTVGATKNFTKALKYHVEKKHKIAIYPEAHIWPYATIIRNYRDASFRYPVEYNCPVYTFVNVYKKRGKKKVRMHTYIDGPFYPNQELPRVEARKELRDRCYNAMVERSKLNEVEVIKYVKKEEL